MNEPISQTSPSRTYHCPSCKQAMRRIEGKMGPFWGCTGFPDCKSTLNDVDGKPSQEVDEHFRCPLCTRRLVKANPQASRDRGEYWFCSGYSKGCKVTLADHNGVPETAYRCLDCGQLLVRRNGKKGQFWGCSAYPECTASYRDRNNGPDF